MIKAQQFKQKQEKVGRRKWSARNTWWKVGNKGLHYSLPTIISKNFKMVKKWRNCNFKTKFSRKGNEILHELAEF